MNCMFSGDQTSNDEHVLPRWMQRRFNLAEQEYYLPNGSAIRYKHAKIPVSDEHNARFGQIEDRISRGSANDLEIYLWAFKIHIGLIFRTANLRTDIRDKNSSTFWSPDDFNDEIWLFRKLYRAWSSGGTIKPSPFGTVLRARALSDLSSFDFVHNMQSGVLFFQLGEEILFVVLYDQGRVAQSNSIELFDLNRIYLKTLSPSKRRVAAGIGQRVWACETAYFWFRSRQGISLITSANDVHAIPPMVWQETRPSDKEEFRVFCHSFGLKLENFGGESNNAFSNLAPEELKGRDF